MEQDPKTIEFLQTNEDISKQKTFGKLKRPIDIPISEHLKREEGPLLK